jgi:hypothetical protein
VAYVKPIPPTAEFAALRLGRAFVP